MKKNVFMILLALALVLSCLFVAAPNAYAADETHNSHCYCVNADEGAVPSEHTCEEGVTWKLLTSSTTLTNGGHYYLNKNTAKGITVTTGMTVTICLNGKNLYAQKPVTISGGGTLILCDCQAAGKIYCTNSANGQGAVVLIDNDGTDAGVFHMYSGTLSGAANYELNIRGVEAKGGIFNMYGGSIVDGKSIDTTKKDNKLGYGGSVCAYNDSGVSTQVKLYGGTITGGEASVNGGNIYLEGGDLTLYGGTIEDGNATGLGGNIYVISTGRTANVKIQGGTVQTGVADCGGNIAAEGKNALTGAAKEAKIVISGGTVTGGVADAEGGNVYVKAGTFEMSDGTVSGGSAKNGGNIATNGDGRRVDMTLSGGTISGGVATKKGGNLYLLNTTNGAVFNLKDSAKITGGSAENGGNIYFSGNHSTTFSGGTISDGTATKNGGNMYVEKNITISGASVEDGTATSNGGNIFISGKLTLSGGTISGGSAADGGSIYMNGASAELIMTDGTVSGGNAENGGSIFIAAGTVDLSGGTITGGTATGTGGNIHVDHIAKLNISGEARIENGKAAHGGNINNFGTTTMDGGTITGGEATSGRGGNVQAHRSTAEDSEGVFTLNDGEISNGSAATRGGNICCAGYDTKTGYFVMNGGRVTGGSAPDGGNIYIQNMSSAEITGGTVTGGTVTGNGADIFLANNASEAGGTLILSGDPTVGALYIINNNNYTVDVSELTCTSPIAVTVKQMGAFADSSVDTSSCFDANDGYEVYYDSAQQKLCVRLVMDIYVSATGDDSAEGSETAPVLTLEKALEIVPDNGTIHLIGTVDVSAWTEHGKSVTLTGGVMNVTTTNSRLVLNDSVRFTDMTITLPGTESSKFWFCCNGYATYIDQNVTVNNGEYAYLIGGSYVSSSPVSSTDLTVLSGTWYLILGGSRYSSISGDVHLTVGGNVNKGVAYTTHGLNTNRVHGGSFSSTSYQADIAGTVYMTVTGDAIAYEFYGGSIGNSSTTTRIGAIQMTVEGGSSMGIYGGGRGGLMEIGSVDMTFTGDAYTEQLFGGSLNASVTVTDELNIYITGGEISRRVYGGCYNEYSLLGFSTENQVAGTINLHIGSGANVSMDYDDSDHCIFAHSRYDVTTPDQEMTRIIFLDEAAYNAHSGKLGAQDSGSKMVMGSSTPAADYICYLGISASGNVITVGAVQKADYVSDALDLASETATVDVEPGTYIYQGAALTPATVVTYSANWTHGEVVVSYAGNDEPGTATAAITLNGVSASTTFEILDYSVEVFINGETKTFYTLQEAIDAAGSKGYVKLTADCGQDVTISADLYLDLDGKNLTGTVTVLEGATLYGMDSATNKYDCTNGYGKISNLVGNYALHHKTTADSKVGKILRYLAVTEDDGSVSFHRFYLGIQYVNLKTSVTGLGYKAIFGGDEKVIAALNETEAFGYSLWQGDNAPTTVYKGSEDFKSGKIVSLRLENIDIENFGSVEIHAQVYLKFGDEIVESATYSYSMQDMLEIINEDIDAYEPAQILAVKNMLTSSTIPEDWNIANILNYSEE